MDNTSPPPPSTSAHPALVPPEVPATVVSRKTRADGAGRDDLMFDAETCRQAHLQRVPYYGNFITDRPHRGRRDFPQQLSWCSVDYETGDLTLKTGEGGKADTDPNLSPGRDSDKDSLLPEQDGLVDDLEDVHNARHHSVSSTPQASPSPVNRSLSPGPRFGSGSRSPSPNPSGRSWIRPLFRRTLTPPSRSLSPKAPAGGRDAGVEVTEKTEGDALCIARGQPLSPSRERVRLFPRQGIVVLKEEEGEDSEDVEGAKEDCSSSDRAEAVTDNSKVPLVMSQVPVVTPESSTINNPSQNTTARRSPCRSRGERENKGTSMMNKVAERLSKSVPLSRHHNHDKDCGAGDGSGSVAVPH